MSEFRPPYIAPNGDSEPLFSDDGEPLENIYNTLIQTTDIEHAPTQDPWILFDPARRINRPDFNFERRFAQTPLSPARLYTNMQEYSRVLRFIQDEQLAHIFASTELASYDAVSGDELQFTEAIRDEILIGFVRRYRGNEAAYHRLRMAVLAEATAVENPELPSEDADLIWRALTAGASLHDMGKLLLRYPVMLSAEAAKYTEPLNPNAPFAMIRHIYEGLGECMRDPDLDLEIFTGNDERIRKRYIKTLTNEEKPSLKPHQIKQRERIVAIKDVIAEMTDGDTVIQLTRKQSFIMLPSEMKLRGVRPYIVETSPFKDPATGKFIPVNLQHIVTSCYWAIPKSDSPSSTGGEAVS